MLIKFFKKIIYYYRHHFERKMYHRLCEYAERGNVNAQFELAQIYESGTLAIKKNFVDAYVLYIMAYLKGENEALGCAQSLEKKMSYDELELARKAAKCLGVSI